MGLEEKENVQRPEDFDMDAYKKGLKATKIYCFHWKRI